MYKTHQDALDNLESESDQLGYNVTYKVVNSANYGVPQTRKRFICVGVKKELPKFEFPLEIVIGLRLTDVDESTHNDTISIFLTDKVSPLHLPYPLLFSVMRL
jgi:site-specific DNA-cytosine methylase